MAGQRFWTQAQDGNRNRRRLRLTTTTGASHDSRAPALALLAFASCGAGGPAHVHSWYPASCCSDRDCAPVNPTSVREAAGGYVVTVQPGSYPMWGKDRAAPLVVRIPYAQAKASPDGQWHLCINGSGDLLCFFAIVGGT